jgi:Pyruvate/2-oxoacid:ferredoxin oxidoreductase delta subunit
VTLMPDPATAVSIDERCTACGACLVTCPERALLRSARRPSVRTDRCTGCLECVEVCPRDAIHLVGVGR